MAITYTADDLKLWLKSDPQFSLYWRFVLDGMARLGHSLEVEYLIGRDFDGTIDHAYVSTGANSQSEAKQWAEDAIREWAGLGATSTSTYFTKLVRNWAMNGPGKGHTAKCIGTTLDFLTLLSAAGSKSSTFDMLSCSSAHKFDVPGTFCWVFADRYSPIDPSETTHPGVNIGGPASSKIGPPGLAEKYWDSFPGNEWTDQTHHFAGYFSFGANWGTATSVVHTALAATSDWSIREQKITNQGDYDLGFLAANWGSSWASKPRFIGKEVEKDLAP